MAGTDGKAGAVKADRDVTFLRLLLEAREPEGDVLTAAVNRTLGRDWSGKPWQVRPLFYRRRGSPPAELSRFFEATGAVETRQFERVAWELAYALEDTGRFVSVRPDLPSGSYQIGEEQAEEGFFGAEVDLPETKPPNYTWALENISVPQAWGLKPPRGGKTHGEGVVVGHPDTGYTRHPQVGLDALDLDRDWDFVSKPEDTDAEDPLERSWVPLASFPGHGTCTGSVIAGRGEGLLTGVAPKAKILPIRAIRTVVEVREGDVARAIYHAIAKQVHVISMSLGGPPFSGVKAAVDLAVREGVIVMAAAGNYIPFRPVVWPARYQNCIAVAATNARREPWSGSSHGSSIAIAAPGTGVWVASWNLDGPEPVTNGIQQSRGTSHAVAHVAGVAALWLAFHGRRKLLRRYGPRLSAAFRHLAATTCHTPPGWDDGEWGPGIIDAAALLAAALPDAGVLADPEAQEVAVAEDGPTIADVLPPEVAARVSQRLAAASGEEGMEGGATAALTASAGRYGDELLYLLLEHPEVRTALTADTGMESATAARATADVRSALRRAASPALLRQLGLA